MWRNTWQGRTGIVAIALALPLPMILEQAQWTRARLQQDLDDATPGKLYTRIE